jgi:hypothetical protein
VFQGARVGRLTTIIEVKNVGDTIEWEPKSTLLGACTSFLLLHPRQIIDHEQKHHAAD